MFWAFFIVDVFFDNRALGQLAATFSICQQVPYVAFTLMVEVMGEESVRLRRG